MNVCISLDVYPLLKSTVNLQKQNKFSCENDITKNSTSCYHVKKQNEVNRVCMDVEGLKMCLIRYNMHYLIPHSQFRKVIPVFVFYCYFIILISKDINPFVKYSL